MKDHLYGALLDANTRDAAQKCKKKMKGRKNFFFHARRVLYFSLVTRLSGARLAPDKRGVTALMRSFGESLPQSRTAFSA